MPLKYKRLITNYCAAQGIAIPSGFARNTPSRYAIIRTDLRPAKLVATTWFKTADVQHYIEHFLQPELGEALSRSIRILDFQEAEELAYNGRKRLDRVATFLVTRNDA
jgi:hypothetical protein